MNIQRVTARFRYHDGSFCHIALSNTSLKRENNSNCYFVIVTREKLSGIPYSVDSIVKMITDKRNRHTIGPIYNIDDK